MKTYLVIDGYNVIHAKPGIESETPGFLEREREELISRCANYAALREYETTLVFDAWVRDEPLTVEQISGITVVYTNKDQTADTYIERFLYQLPKLNRKMAVTSDGAVQKMALMTGAERVTSLEFLGRLERAEKKNAQAKTDNDTGVNPVGEYLEDHQKETIEAIRRGEKPDPEQLRLAKEQIRQEKREAAAAKKQAAKSVPVRIEIPEDKTPKSKSALKREKTKKRKGGKRPNRGSGAVKKDNKKN